MSSDGIHNVYDDTQLMADIDDIIEDLEIIDNEIEALQVDVDTIEATTSALGILENAGGELTTDGTEQTVYINNAPAGVYEPRWLKIDFANQTVTETVRILVYYRIAPAGPWVIDDRETIVGVPVNAGISIELKPTRYGVWVTMETLAGDYHAHDWEVLYEV